MYVVLYKSLNGRSIILFSYNVKCKVANCHFSVLLLNLKNGLIYSQNI